MIKQLFLLSALLAAVPVCGASDMGTLQIELWMSDTIYDTQAVPITPNGHRCFLACRDGVCAVLLDCKFAAYQKDIKRGITFVATECYTDQDSTTASTKSYRCSVPYGRSAEKALLLSSSTIKLTHLLSNK